MSTYEPSTTTSSTPKEISLLFVCLGNICRSPMAEGVFAHLLSTHTPRPSASPYSITHISSAGTGAYHLAAPPDPRTMRVLQQNNIKGYSHSAQKVQVDDFVKYTHIFGMDQDNYEDLLDMKGGIERARKSGKGKGEESPCASVQRHQGSLRGGVRTRSQAYKIAGADSGRPLASVHLYGEFGGKRKDEEVIDPYYGGNDGFSTAFEQVERFGRGFLKYLDEGGAADGGKSGKM